MPVCDVCSARMEFSEGYALTTREVVLTTTYWEYFIGERARHLLSGGAQNAFELVETARQAAGQSTGWLLCENCSGQGYSFDQARAKEHACKKQNPPDCAPVPFEEALTFARLARSNLLGRTTPSFPTASQSSSGLSVEGSQTGDGGQADTPINAPTDADSSGPRGIAKRNLMIAWIVLMGLMILFVAYKLLTG